MLQLWFITALVNLSNTGFSVFEFFKGTTWSWTVLSAEYLCWLLKNTFTMTYGFEANISFVSTASKSVLVVKTFRSKYLPTFRVDTLDLQRVVSHATTAKLKET